ncbi:MAG: hypothetical protein EOP42_07240 [Sphingobacteriaceae bacterium]|nr:MAG: hypothetical protein EOP42_07240 [Sphingobacteriaceae bacterium]
MESTATIISVTIAVLSAIVAIWTIASLLLKVKNSKNVTLTNKVNGKKVTVSTQYDRQNIKKIMEFAK